jgi:hypothetical protein
MVPSLVVVWTDFEMLSALGSGTLLENEKNKNQF